MYADPEVSAVVAGGLEAQELYYVMPDESSKV